MLFPLLLNKLLLKLGKRVSACTFDHMFVRLLSLCWERLFVVCHLSKNFSGFHSAVIVCAEDIRVLFRLLLKFRNVLKHAESRGSLV